MLAARAGGRRVFRSYGEAMLGARAAGRDLPPTEISAPGVGPLVAITFKTAINDGLGSENPRPLGALLGLTPRKYQSRRNGRDQRIRRRRDGARHGL